MTQSCSRTSKAESRRPDPDAPGANARLPVETAGIEPASAVAQGVASTSVSGALISPSARHAGGVAEGQPPEGVPGSAEAGLPG